MHEWPMRKPKEKWPVKELMVRGQRRLLKRWLRYAENLNGPEEEMVQVCEPETGRDLSELGSFEDLKNCQEGREEIPVFQVGNELRSLRDLTDCQEDSQGISHCQVGNEMRSLRDLTDCQEGSERFPVCQVGKETEMELVDSMDCQEGSRDIPYCQVGRDEQVSFDQPEELTEQMSSGSHKFSGFRSAGAADRGGRSEDNILMIGGIGVFLPLFPGGGRSLCCRWCSNNRRTVS
jgi:hypothetical protein